MEIVEICLVAEVARRREVVRAWLDRRKGEDAGGAIHTCRIVVGGVEGCGVNRLREAHARDRITRRQASELTGDLLWSGERCYSLPSFGRVAVGLRQRLVGG